MKDEGNVIKLPTAYRGTHVAITQREFLAALFGFLLKLNIVEDKQTYREFVLEYMPELNNIVDLL